MINDISRAFFEAKASKLVCCELPEDYPGNEDDDNSDGLDKEEVFRYMASGSTNSPHFIQCFPYQNQTRNIDELPQVIPKYHMMRSVDVRKWVDDQWEHYTEEGAEIMIKEDIKELVAQAFVELGLGDIPQDKYESLLEMRTDENYDYVEKDEIKEIVEELVLHGDNKRR